jgi:hypothetical protein
MTLKELRALVEKESELTEKIDDFNENESFGFFRLQLTFKNGYGLSIITGQSADCSYGNFEISPVNKNGDLQGDLLNLKNKNIEGYVQPEKVIEYAVKLANMN